MTPVDFLVLSALIALLAWGGHRMARIRRRNRLQRLARERRMQYVAADPFRLGVRMKDLLPVPGCSDIHVCDVMYGQTEAGDRRYVFQVGYTLGVIRTKRRETRIGALLERANADGVADRFFLLDRNEIGPTTYSEALDRLAAANTQGSA